MQATDQSYFQLVVQNAASLVVAHKLQISSSGPKYEPLTAVVLSEGLKLACSVGTSLYLAAGRHRTWTDSLACFRTGHRHAAVPAVLYTVAASAQAVGAYHLPLLVYLILSQIKLLLTPLFGVVLLRRTLDRRHQLCIGLLAGGMVLLQHVSANEARSQNADMSRSTGVGALAMVAAGICVAASGVYTEAMLQKSRGFLIPNAQLAGYSCIFAIIGLLASSQTGIGSFFRGYHLLTWVFVAIQALGGFLVAWCLLLSSTVAKNYAQALGFLTASVSSLVVENPQAISYVGVLNSMELLFIC
ncbi:hypothetical protein ACJZ2D_001748 [Fusarium nematophilum]